MKKNWAGLTAAGVMVTALVAGAAGGAIAYSAAQGSEPAAPPAVALHQVAETVATAPEVTSAPVAEEESATAASPAAPVVTAPDAAAGETASQAADRATVEADRATDAADRAEVATTPAAPAEPAPAPTVEPAPVQHSCPSGTKWDGDPGRGNEPQCVLTACPPGSTLQPATPSHGLPWCMEDAPVIRPTTEPAKKTPAPAPTVTDPGPTTPES